MEDATLDLLVQIVGQHLGLGSVPVPRPLTPRTAVEPPAGTPPALGQSRPSPDPQPLQPAPPRSPAPPIDVPPPDGTSPSAPVLPALQPSRDANAPCDAAGCPTGPRSLWSVRVHTSSIKGQPLADVADLCPAHLGLYLAWLATSGAHPQPYGPIEIERSQRWLGSEAAAARQPAPRRPRKAASPR